eukprot:gene2550-526_t
MPQYTRENGSPSLLSEFMHAIARVIADYTGHLSEASVKHNQHLIYEILDESVDFGYIQSTSSSFLKNYVYGIPVIVDLNDGKTIEEKAGWQIKPRGPDSHNQGECNRSIISTSNQRKNEVFVNVTETLNATFGLDNKPVQAEVDGSITCRSFLLGAPEVHIGLNHSLILAKEDAVKGRKDPGAVVVDSYNLHKLTLKLRADIPETCKATNVLVKCVVPAATSKVHFDFSAMSKAVSCEWKQGERCIIFGLKSIDSGTEVLLRAKISSSGVIRQAKQGLGPVSMKFVANEFCASGMNISFLRIDERSKHLSPQRWIR